MLTTINYRDKFSSAAALEPPEVLSNRTGTQLKSKEVTRVLSKQELGNEASTQVPCKRENEKSLDVNKNEWLLIATGELNNNLDMLIDNLNSDVNLYIERLNVKNVNALMGQNNSDKETDLAQDILTYNTHERINLSNQIDLIINAGIVYSVLKNLKVYTNENLNFDNFPLVTDSQLQEIKKIYTRKWIYRANNFMNGEGTLKESKFGDKFSTKKLILEMNTNNDKVAENMLLQNFGVKSINDFLIKIGADTIFVEEGALTCTGTVNDLKKVIDFVIKCNQELPEDLNNLLFIGSNHRYNTDSNTLIKSKVKLTELSQYTRVYKIYNNLTQYLVIFSLDTSSLVNTPLELLESTVEEYSLEVEKSIMDIFK